MDLPTTTMTVDGKRAELILDGIKNERNNTDPDASEYHAFLNQFELEIRNALTRIKIALPEANRKKEAARLRREREGK